MLAIGIGFCCGLWFSRKKERPVAAGRYRLLIAKVPLFPCNVPLVIPGAGSVSGGTPEVKGYKKTGASENVQGYPSFLTF